MRVYVKLWSIYQAYDPHLLLKVAGDLFLSHFYVY